jgi:hypothetical protein
MSFVDKDLLEPGCSVLLHNKVRTSHLSQPIDCPYLCVHTSADLALSSFRCAQIQCCIRSISLVSSSTPQRALLVISAHICSVRLACDLLRFLKPVCQRGLVSALCSSSPLVFCSSIGAVGGRYPVRRGRPAR